MLLFDIYTAMRNQHWSASALLNEPFTIASSSSTPGYRTTKINTTRWAFPTITAFCGTIHQIQADPLCGEKLAIKHSLKFVKPNKNTFAESFNTSTRIWTNPINGLTFDVSHLCAFFMNISYTKNKVKRTVRARISFSAHCYTRSQEHLDDDELLVVTEFIVKRRGEVEQKKRIFDEERWIYSQCLPALMREVQNMSCTRDDDNQVVIHLAPRNRNRPGEGWYTFVRVQIDPKFPDIVQLEVRTTHRRMGHPSSSRHPIRFSQHLAELLDE